MGLDHDRGSSLPSGKTSRLFRSEAAFEDQACTEVLVASESSGGSDPGSGEPPGTAEFDVNVTDVQTDGRSVIVEYTAENTGDAGGDAEVSVTADYGDDGTANEGETFTHTLVQGDSTSNTHQFTAPEGAGDVGVCVELTSPASQGFAPQSVSGQFPVRTETVQVGNDRFRSDISAAITGVEQVGGSTYRVDIEVRYTAQTERGFDAQPDVTVTVDGNEVWTSDYGPGANEVLYQTEQHSAETELSDGSHELCVTMATLGA